jgi:glutathione S-transferase
VRWNAPEAGLTYVLYYYPGNASLLPHMALREAGVPFELRLVDRTQDAQHSPAYLRLNPNGRIPVLLHGDLVLYETAAITLYLADQHPDAGLAPPVGTAERARFYRWMVHLTNTPQAEYRAWFYPEQHVADPAAAAAVKHAAGERLGRMFGIIADQLGDGPWLLGERFSAADLFLLMLVRWGRAMPRPPRDRPALAAHARRVLGRPAVMATFAAESLAEPLI